MNFLTNGIDFFFFSNSIFNNEVVHINHTSVRMQVAVSILAYNSILQLSLPFTLSFLFFVLKFSRFLYLKYLLKRISGIRPRITAGYPEHFIPAKLIFTLNHSILKIESRKICVSETN